MMQTQETAGRHIRRTACEAGTHTPITRESAAQTTPAHGPLHGFSPDQLGRFARSALCSCSSARAARAPASNPVGYAAE